MTDQMTETPRKPYIKPAVEEVTLRLEEAVLGSFPDPSWYPDEEL